MDIHKVFVEDYKCLKNFTLEVPINEENNDKGITPLVLVGLNGAGKSSLLEALAIMFNYQYSNKKNSKEKINGEIQYSLSEDEKFTLKNNKISLDKKTNEDDKKPVSELNKPQYLIAYSSGLNNKTISDKFQKINDEYYDALKDSVTNNDISNIKDINQSIQRKAIYIDYNVNKYLFISLFLFKNEKLMNLFSEIEELDMEKAISFEVKWIPPSFTLPSDMQDFLNILEKHNISKKLNKKEEKNYKVLLNNQKFLIDIEDILKIYDSIKFFELIDNFELLNNKSKAKFEITNIEIKLSESNKIVDYECLSDGQHQLIHVLGILLMFENTKSLILLDEPDTHLNPSLRAKFISLVNEVVESKKPQIIIATHSPFIIGDTPRENIRLFKRNDEGKIRNEEITWETFGASLSLILSKIFGLQNGISGYAEEKIEKLLQSEDKAKIKAEIDNFGKSPLKAELYGILDE